MSACILFPSRERPWHRSNQWRRRWGTTKASSGSAVEPRDGRASRGEFVEHEQPLPGEGWYQPTGEHVYHAAAAGKEAAAGVRQADISRIGLR